MFKDVHRGRVSLYHTIHNSSSLLSSLLSIYIYSQALLQQPVSSSCAFFPSRLSLSINDMSCVCFVYANKYIIKWEKKLHTADERRRHDNGMGDPLHKQFEKINVNSKWKGIHSAMGKEWRRNVFSSLDAGNVFFVVTPNGIAGGRQCLNKNQMRVRCEVPIMCFFIGIMTLRC